MSAAISRVAGLSEYRHVKPTGRLRVSMPSEVAVLLLEDMLAVQSRRLIQRSGVGPTTATAIVASIGKGHDFKNGCQYSALLGLVPRQNSSGGKTKLGSITKAGDSYLRMLLVLGARALLLSAPNKTDPVSR